MAFPTGKTTSGLKSDRGGSNYVYRTGVQPNGTASIGNWNTGGSVAGYGNSKGVYDRAGNRIGGQNTDPRLTGGPNVWNPPAQSPSGYSFQFNPGGYAGGVEKAPVPAVKRKVPQVPMGFGIGDMINWVRNRVRQDVPEEVVPGYRPTGYTSPGVEPDPYFGGGQIKPTMPNGRQGSYYPGYHYVNSGGTPQANQVVAQSGGVSKFQDRVPQPSWGDNGSFNYGGRR